MATNTSQTSGQPNELTSVKPVSLTQRPWFKPVLAGALIFFAVLLVYFPAMQGEFIWDDEVTVTDSFLLKRTSGLFDIWFSTQPHDYWPLTYTSLWIEWRLWEMNPMGYHITNILLHALGCILLWRVLLRLKIPGAWLAALIFALHPVCVSSAAWISERKNVLSLVFYLASILYYLRAREGISGTVPPTRSPARPLTRRFYFLSIFYFLLALLSKSSVVMLPFVLLLCDWWLARRDSRSSSSPFLPFSLSRLWRVAPFFILSLVLGLVTVWFQKNRAIGYEGFVSSPLLERLVAGSWAVWFYLCKALVPVGLTALYPRWEVDTQSLVSYLPGMGWLMLLGVCFYFLRRARSDAPYLAAVFFALMYFSLMLLPVLGIFDMFYLHMSRVADHWQYLALIGPVTLVVAGLSCAIERLRRTSIPGAKIGGMFLSAGLVILLGCLSWNRSTIYANAELLWTDAMKKNPKSWVPPSDLGVAFIKQGRLDEALPLFRKSIAIKGDEGISHNNLGMALFEKGELDQAIESYREALRVRLYYYPAHFNLAVVLGRKEKWEEAIEHYQEVINRRPDHEEAHNNLANILGRLGKTNEAKAYYMEAVRLRPNFSEANFNLGERLAMEGKPDEALKHYERAIKERPAYANARTRLGEIALAQSRPDEAVEHFSIALLEEPKMVKAINGLARSLISQGKMSEALKHLERAIKEKPDSGDAYYLLGNILMNQGKTNEVMTRFSSVIESRPELSEPYYFVGIVLRQQGNSREAIASWRKAAELNTNWVEVLNNLAWELAANPDATLRNGAEAVRLATRIVELTNNQDPALLDTLGAAYAEAGRFADATAVAQQALDMAMKAGLKEMAKDMEKRLALYKTGQPWRDP